MKKKGVALSVKNGRKTVTGLGYYECMQVENFKELIRNSIAKFQSKPAFRFKRDNAVAEKTYIEFGKEIDALGTALHSLGLKNKRIAIIGENRYEWALSFFSIVNGTGIAVPLDKHLPQLEIENLIRRGKVDAVFYSNHFNKEMLELSGRNTGIAQFISMDRLEGNPPENFISIKELMEKGKKLLASGDKSFTDAEINQEELSVLLFTSGTTSMSKGVKLNQRNICSNVSAITSVIRVYPTDVHLSVLPLHHTFELSAGMVFMLNNGVCIAYSEGIKHIAKNLKEFRVTVLVVVPAILEAVYKKVQEGIRKSGKERQVLAAAKLSSALRSIGIDLRKKFFKKILAQIGPDLRLAVSGAAPIGKEIIYGFDMLGLNVIQGYGLTETSPVVALNNDFYNKAGTIGQPMKGIEVAIDSPDENGMGEIITKGPHVMMGYYEDEPATKEAIDSYGWFHTGDLGIIDDEGFITITGRAKSMIVLNNGKKAFPEEYEILLNNIDEVKEAFVWGNTAPDGDIQVCAKLVLDKNKLKEKYGTEPEDSVLADILQKEIKNINQELPQYKIIRYFVISYEELIKTTTLKIKRPMEYKKITGLLDALNINIRKINGTNIDGF
ncbi:long-chain acyl-CoA synthetase [Ruminiclostridium sufflavum DSM 19573]|uniref:Long-chain acyl-CoA synthetase n=1 Tax=Ruminiclostridium sufflavum DSM 19573 TaxID=1121337 RepID=A0A318Y6Z0_9FIRM|nr:AMP-binding protein [Ruminiclostridium sufflavum]PYG87847.1 long-chain acyl-CoA synthetase [Ruminiclostridium sufflavum DSM 19573]